MPKIPSIHVLDELTASRIAAGEVIERPASVVKELIENSLDAGATDIRIETQAGGRRLIRVSDNGHGIPPEQVEAAFQRHATSKIQAVADLERVSTLGFRGEALTSIAAVCHVTLLTCAAGAETGLKVRLDNGRVVSREAVGVPRGTVVTAENLFHAVPARLKFLRTDTTEAGRIHDIVTRYALAYPDRRILLVRDGRTAFQSPGTGAIEDTLVAVFGLDVAREMITVRLDAPVGAPIRARQPAWPVSVAGYVSPPHVHRATRRQITLFVNGRWVQDTSLAYAVVQAYHTLLPKGRFPLAVVLVTLPPEAVDVNVHPSKTEIRFRDSRPVFRAVERSVRRAVVGGAPVAPMGTPERSHWDVRRPPASGDPLKVGPPDTGAEQTTYLDGEAAGLPVLRVVGQVAQTYIVAEGPDGLYLIDQHAAHERVLYERLMSRRGDPLLQRLLTPEAVALQPTEMAAVESHTAAFTALGFELESFGPDTALVRALPDGLGTADVPGLVAAVIDTALEGGDFLEEAFEERLVRAVCKQATIKAGQTLSIEEMRALVRQLEETQSPRTCPHGRPTMVVLGGERLAHEFGRA